MKHVIFALALSLTASVAFAAEECKQDIDCSGLSFEWVPGGNFKVTLDVGRQMDPLDQNVCAVRHFCPVQKTDGKTPDFSQPVIVPEGIENSDANQRQLAAACQEAIDSQASNACYTQDIWNSQDSIYGTSALGSEKK